MRPEPPFIRAETSAPHVRALLIDRPDKRNALSDPVLEELAEAIEAAARDEDVRCLVVAGAKDVFAAGADIARFAAMDGRAVLDDARPGLWRRIAACPKPLVAGVEGWCLGAGTELVLHADIAVAARGARFALPEVSLGLMPGAGGTQRLPRSLSKSNAMLMVLTGDRFEAAEAHRMGLVSDVVEDGRARERAVEIAARIASRAPLAVRLAKRAVLRSYETGLGAGLETERDLYATAFATNDRAEGVAAFQEKRAPRFEGR